MSTSHLLILFLIALAFTLPMIGCAPNSPYRADIKNPASPAYPVNTDPDYSLGFVEFDDQGWFWNDAQRALVETMIRDQANLAPASPAPTQGIILVTFVHGWKHNADLADSNVAAFRTGLTELARAEREQAATASPPRPARKVVGVYVGWRGLSAKFEPFLELSFWTRKDTAHKVGGYGGLTRLLVELEQIQLDSNKALKNHPESPRTELVIIGHSFGAAAVYSAIGQILTERFVDSLQRPHPTRLKPLGDQVILLNPAFEASRHYDLNELATCLQHYPDDQRPVLSIFTSRTDWATHYAFPVGRFFDTLFENNRNSKQKNAGLQTVGWFSDFVTHDLKYDPDHTNYPATQPTPRVSTLNPITRKHQLHAQPEMIQSVQNIRAQRQRWQPNADAPKDYYFDDTVLHPCAKYRPGDPFLIVAVDKQIMDGHNDITNPVLLNFLREYIQFCQVDPKDHSK